MPNTAAPNTLSPNTPGPGAPGPGPSPLDLTTAYLDRFLTLTQGQVIGLAVRYINESTGQVSLIRTTRVTIA